MFSKITNVRMVAVDETGLLGCRDARNRNCNYAELRHGNGGFRRAASRRDSSRHAWHTRQLTLIYISERDFGPFVLYHHSHQLGESIWTLHYFFYLGCLLYSLLRLLRLLIQLPDSCRNTNWNILCINKMKICSLKLTTFIWFVSDYIFFLYLLGAYNNVSLNLTLSSPPLSLFLFFNYIKVILPDMEASFIDSL